MLSRRPGLSILIASAFIGMASAGAMVQPAPIVRSHAVSTAPVGIMGGKTLHTSTWKRKFHQSMAEQQRASRKARNVKRHKRAVRGAK